MKRASHAAGRRRARATRLAGRLLLLWTAIAGPLAAVALAAADSASSWNETIPAARPEEVGLSSERLARIRPVFERYVESGSIAGAVGAVVRHGRLAYLETWGYRDRAAGSPMTDDAIFRIFSMSKAITGVAVMMLHEEQGFPLTTPVSRWLPPTTTSPTAASSRPWRTRRSSTRAARTPPAPAPAGPTP